MRQRIAVSAAMVAAGVILGLVGARYVFVNSGLSLIPWGLASLGIGIFATSRRAAIGSAAVFGFALALSFMLFGYDGKDPVVSVVAAFCLLGLVGSVCAMVLALVGWFLRTRIIISDRRRQSS